MRNIATGVLALVGLYGLFLLLQQFLWTLIAVQIYIPWVAGAVLIAYCFRKVLVYKRSVKNDTRLY
jgi:hypothetical protein